VVGDLHERVADFGQRSQVASPATNKSHHR
jgi:hypothetical protein